MKIDNIQVFGFRAALRGMRNPMESWSRSDTTFGDGTCDPTIDCPEMPNIGPNDLELACKLIRAGSGHCKFMRQIMIWCDMTVSRCIWQELDTYKVATVKDSCSTMHKLGHRDLTRCDFEDGDVDRDILDALNEMGSAYRKKIVYIEKKDERRFTNPRSYIGRDLLIHMKRRLPEGFLQMATYSFNYETALNMLRSRSNHKMPEWSGPNGICEMLRRLPYLKTFFDA